MKCKGHRWPLSILLAFAIAGGTRPSQASAEFETPIVVSNVTVVTGTGRTIESGTIVMSQGRIIAVGRDVDVPAEALPIDATGLIAYPGFIDAHTHLGIADRVGSIEVGKHADLIVTTDTPLQTVSRVTHVFIDRRPIELTSVHTELYEKFKNRPRPTLAPAPDLIGPPNLSRR